jgi:ectoine hydroxylase-related dioxygenase (phytanoyl-CoA dioxygenase family)
MENYTADIHSRFSRNGVLVIDHAVIPPDAVNAAFDAAGAVRAGIYSTDVPPNGTHGCGEGQLCKINDAHIADRDIYRLVTSREIGQLAATATRASMVQVWATQLLIKPPTKGDAANVGWHQDRQYWQSWDEPDGLLTAWVALSQVRESSGPVRFVVGSHAWGFLDSGDFFASDNDSIRNGIPVPDGERWEETAAVLPPGGVSFHHSLTYHGSGPNVSRDDRVSVAIHLRTEKAHPVADYPDPYVTLSHLDDPAVCPVIYEST